jgi:hypothetical protein
MVRMLRISGWTISSKPRRLRYLEEKCLDALHRLEVRAGTGIEPMWAGTNATNVPKEAIVVDNADANIRLSDISLWDTEQQTRFYSPSSLVATKRGASLNYTFEGVAIW